MTAWKLGVTIEVTVDGVKREMGVIYGEYTRRADSNYMQRLYVGTTEYPADFDASARAFNNMSIDEIGYDVPELAGLLNNHEGFVIEVCFAGHRGEAIIVEDDLTAEDFVELERIIDESNEAALKELVDGKTCVVFGIWELGGA